MAPYWTDAHPFRCTYGSFRLVNADDKFVKRRVKDLAIFLRCEQHILRFPAVTAAIGGIKGPVGGADVGI